MEKIAALWITQHRLKLFWLGLFTLALFGWGLNKIQLTSELRSLLDEDHAGLSTIDEVNDYFEIPRSFIVFLYKNESQLDTENLAEIDKLSSALELEPAITSARSLANSTFIFSVNDDIHIDYLFNRDSPTDYLKTDYEQVKRWLLREPTLENSFVSSDGKMSAIVLNTNLSQDASVNDMKEVHSFILKEAAFFQENNPLYRVDIGGELAFDLAEDETFINDFKQNMGLSLLFIFMLLLILFRSFLSACVIFIVSVFSCVSALGFSGFYELQINNINLTAPIIIIVVAVLNGIHFINVYLSKREKLSVTESIKSTVELNFKPISLTTITTATGFITLNVSSSPAISSLGTIAAIGILMAWFFTFTLLPSLSSFTKPKAHTEKQEDWIDRLLNSIRTFVIKTPNKIIYFFTIVFIGLITQIPKIVVDDAPFDSLDESLPYVQSKLFFQEKMHSDSFTLYFNTGEAGGIHNARFLRGVDTLAAWIKSQAGVINAYSYVDHMKRINQIMHEDDAAYYQVPESDSLAAQYGLLYKFSIPSPDEISRYTDLDDQRIIVNVLTDDISRGDFNKLVSDINLKAAELQLSDKVKITGWATLFNSEIMKWVRELILGFAVAFLVISLQMFVFFRSLKIGAISLIPNLLPIGITLGIWGISNQPLGFISLLVLSVSFGIVIDDTIHFISKFLDGIRENQTAHDALEHAFKYSGRAIIITTVALAIGMSPMLFSNFVPLQSITKLITPIAIFALIVDLFLLPAILLKVYNKTRFSDAVT